MPLARFLLRTAIPAACRAGLMSLQRNFFPLPDVDPDFAVMPHFLEVPPQPTWTRYFPPLLRL